MKDPITMVVADLKQKYNPQTIILYGSWARKEATETSDIDIACFCDNDKTSQDTRWLDGFLLDAWIYPTHYLKEVSDDALRFGDGVILHDTDGMGRTFIDRVKDKLDTGRTPLSSIELQHLSGWVYKMLERSYQTDIDGNYRRIWLQTDLLPIYFDVRGLWYLGPKKSFEYLKSCDRESYLLFQQTYSEPTNTSILRALIERVFAVQQSK